MKKFIILFLKFIIFTTIFYCSALLLSEIYLPQYLRPNLISKRVHGHMSLRTKEVKNIKNVDILFLGSSHTYRGFDTRIFKKIGLNTFNLGSSSQTHIQTKVLLSRYLETLNPKTIIYEVYPRVFQSDGLESSLDIIMNDENDLNSFKMALEINNIKTYNTFIYRFTYDLLNLNNSFTKPIINGYDKYVSGGYVEKEISFFKPTLFKRKKIVLNPNQLKYFSENVEMIKSKNIKLILVYAPISKVEYKSYTNINYFDNLMDGYSNYFNFNEIICLNDSLHFYDSTHLNQNGVEIFNKRLIKLLNKNNVQQSALIK